MLKNGWALVARFLAYFAILPAIGIVPGVIAIGLGIQGISYSRRHPGALGRGSSIFAITWSSIWTGLWGIVVLVGLVRSRGV